MSSEITSEERTPARRNGRIVAICVAVAVLLSIGGVVSTRWIRSPQQRLAETASPPPTVLTVPVERRILKDTVVIRGQVGAGRRIEVTPSVGESGVPVVTGVRVGAGKRFKAGAVLAEVSGRPVIALPGRIPAYRDLRPGSSGQDVKQLQKALTTIGFPVSGESGRFGPRTKSALSDFYESIGYEAPTTGDADALTSAADSVRLAERAVDDAKEALKAPGAAADKSLQKALRYAKEDLSRARATRSDLVAGSGPMLPLAEMVFLPAFPGRMEKVNGSIGSEVKPPLLTLSSGDLVITGRLDPAQRQLIEPGMKVTAISELTGDEFDAEVTTIGDLSADESGSRSHPMTVVSRGKKIPEKLAGADLRITVEAASTEEPVLVVPVTALFAAADGSTSVQKRTADGATEIVTVTVGSAGSGFSSVTPTGGTLDEGDAVVVGQG